MLRLEKAEGSDKNWIDEEETGRMSAGENREISGRQQKMGESSENSIEADQAHKLRISKEYGRITINPGSCPQRVNGARALNSARARDLIKLEQSRGGWRKSPRNFYLSFYAQFLRGAGETSLSIVSALRVMASNCKPPYPSDYNDPSLQSIVNSQCDGVYRKVTNYNLVEWLQITTDEARSLELETLLPTEVQVERRAPFGGERRIKQNQRRAFIAGWIKEHGMTSCRHLVKELASAGIPASAQSVNEDLHFLGYAMTQPRKKPGRLSKEQLNIPDLSE